MVIIGRLTALAIVTIFLLAVFGVIPIISIHFLFAVCVTMPFILTAIMAVGRTDAKVDATCGITKNEITALAKKRAYEEYENLYGGK